MADNDILVDGKAVAAKDRSNVRFQQFLEADAITASVIVASVDQSSATAKITAAAGARRGLLVQNTGTVPVEISPTQNFALGAGFTLDVGGFMGISYSGAIYARCSAGTGEIRAWSEA